MSKSKYQMKSKCFNVILRLKDCHLGLRFCLTFELCNLSFQKLYSSSVSPFTPSQPSFSRNGMSARAATGSAHHQPHRALAPSPSRTVKSWRSQTRLSMASPRRAGEPSFLDRLSLGKKT